MVLSNSDTQQGPGTSGQTDLDASPGERTMKPLYKNSVVSAAAPTSKPIGVGAQVGILRNLEFSAGGRAHRISTGPYTKA